MKNVVNIDGLTTFTSPSFPESHSVANGAAKYMMCREIANFPISNEAIFRSLSPTCSFPQLAVQKLSPFLANCTSCPTIPTISHICRSFLRTRRPKCAPGSISKSPEKRIVLSLFLSSSYPSSTRYVNTSIRIFFPFTPLSIECALSTQSQPYHYTGIHDLSLRRNKVKRAEGSNGEKEEKN